MTPATRNLIEVIHGGAVLTMHYRRDDSGENTPRFVLEPKGKPIYAPTAILAVRSGYLKATDDGLPGLAVTQTWTAGESLPPIPWEPPAIKGSTVRDTTVRGLTVRFNADIARIFLQASGEPLFKPVVMTCGRRAFVERVDKSDLASVNWLTTPSLSMATASHRAAADRARTQIVATP